MNTLCWHLAAALAAGLSIAGCGGGDEDASVPRGAQRAAAEAPPNAVQLEGCVVEKFYIPRTGTPARALSADGRLLANGASDEAGIFRLIVPAQLALWVSIDRPDGEALSVSTGRSNLSLGGCLFDPEA
jgi:hypothetical protein